MVLPLIAFSLCIDRGPMGHVVSHIFQPNRDFSWPDGLGLDWVGQLNRQLALSKV